MHALVNYGQLITPGIKNVVMGLAMAQQYHVNKGLKVFGECGREAVMKELKQLNDLEVIQPRNWSKLTAEQRRTALPYLMFLKLEDVLMGVNKKWIKKMYQHQSYQQMHCLLH